MDIRLAGKGGSNELERTLLDSTQSTRVVKFNCGLSDSLTDDDTMSAFRGC